MKTVPTTDMAVIWSNLSDKDNETRDRGFLTKGWSTLLEGLPNMITNPHPAPAHCLVSLCVGISPKKYPAYWL